MRVLVIGSGGREHALAWAIAASPLVDQLYCAPGNAGIAEEAECVAIAASDTRGIIEFCRHAAIDFVVVGPEAPLVGGLVDALEEAGIAAFGPSAAAAVLEGSKGFMKDLCARENIPTARYRRFRDAGAAKTYIAEEASFFALVDGIDALPLAAAQDHKRVGDGDKGPNTGGMGAYSPAVAVTPAIEGAVMDRIILPTVRAMQ